MGEPDVDAGDRKKATYSREELPRLIQKVLAEVGITISEDRI